jgi:hypothetical protein
MNYATYKPSNHRNPFGRFASFLAVLVSGIHLYQILGPRSNWAIAYMVIGFCCIGMKDRIYEHLYYGKRMYFGFGGWYWTAFCLFIPVGHFINKMNTNLFDFQSMMILSLATSMFANLWTSVTEIGWKIFCNEHMARHFGEEWSDKFETEMEPIWEEEDYRWRNRNRKTGELAPPRQPDPTKGYLSFEPDYTDFKPPLSWTLFCEGCSARNQKTNDRCWNCHGFGQEYLNNLANPNVVYRKSEIYPLYPCPQEPIYQNGIPPINWVHKCALCGARCEHEEDSCWYCDEKGRLWGEHNKLACPHQDTWYSDEYPEDGYTAPVRPRR